MLLSHRYNTQLDLPLSLIPLHSERTIRQDTIPYNSTYYELHYKLGRTMHCNTLQSANRREMFDV